jgi:glycosyltransferase involved in cell wall biosynthesis
MPLKPKTAIVSVINDLVTDQRVARTCVLLTESGYHVIQVGRILPGSPPLPQKPWKMHRMWLVFKKGPLFYAEYNLRLFFFLLFRHTNLLFSNDLDTLLPNFLIHKIKRIPLVYDSHEFFTETPELTNRPLVRSIWLGLEKRILPRLRYVMTVNESLAAIFSRKYGIPVLSIRNVPPRQEMPQKSDRGTLGLPARKNIILLQGSGINIHRGAEELIQAMAFLHETILLVIGGGDVIDTLKNMALQPDIDGKVIFLPRMPREELMRYTASVDLGLSVDKDICPNYHFSLPNKIFDYIHAGIPVLASALPEIRKIVEGYGVGRCIHSHIPQALAHDIRSMLNDKAMLETYRSNCLKSREILCWENEKKPLVQLYESLQ